MLLGPLGRHHQPLIACPSIRRAQHIAGPATMHSLEQHQAQSPQPPAAHSARGAAQRDLEPFMQQLSQAAERPAEHCTGPTEHCQQSPQLQQAARAAMLGRQPHPRGLLARPACGSPVQPVGMLRPALQARVPGIQPAARRHASMLPVSAALNRPGPRPSGSDGDDDEKKKGKGEAQPAVRAGSRRSWLQGGRHKSCALTPALLGCCAAGGQHAEGSGQQAGRRPDKGKGQPRPGKGG